LPSTPTPVMMSIFFKLPERY